MKVTLLKPHEHAGQKHAAGDEIDVTKPTAQWLDGRGLIKLPAAPKAAADKTKESQ